jgi:hypothetical protein
MHKSCASAADWSRLSAAPEALFAITIDSHIWESMDAQPAIEHRDRGA